MNVASEFRGEDGNATGGVVQIEEAFSAVRASPCPPQDTPQEKIDDQTTSQLEKGQSRLPTRQQ